MPHRSNLNKNVTVKKELSKEVLNSKNYLVPFDKLLDNFFVDMYPEWQTNYGFSPFGESSFPKVNVTSNESSVTIEAEMAGYKKEDVSIEVDDSGILRIIGKVSSLFEQTDKSVYLIRELKRSGFSRSFKLNEQLDTSNITAKFKEGLLIISIPRKVKPPEETLVKKVTIN